MSDGFLVGWLLATEPESKDFKYIGNGIQRAASNCSILAQSSIDLNLRNL